MKGNRQGFLSRSITRRSGQDCKIILHFYILQFCRQLVKKVQTDFFDKLSRRSSLSGCSCGLSDRVAGIMAGLQKKQSL